MDIEIYRSKNQYEYDNSEKIVQEIIDKVNSLGISFKTIVLESHSEMLNKHSYHLIFRASNHIYFNCVKSFKKVVENLFPELTKKKIIDLSVYREGLFRTVYSTKSGESRYLTWNTRLSSEFGEDQEPDLLTFVTYTPGAGVNEENVVVLADSLHAALVGALDDASDSDRDRDRGRDSDSDSDSDNNSWSTNRELEDLSKSDHEVVKTFVRKNYRYRNSSFRDIFIDRSRNCIIIALDDTFCHNIDREHRSNHQYIVIDTVSSKQKCHDTECREFKMNEIAISKFPTELNEIILKCLKVNKREQELIEKAIGDCKDYITNNFDENISNITFDRNEMVFRGDASTDALVNIRGKCTNCKLEHHITNSGYCMKCNVCNTIYPKNQLIPLDDRYKNLNAFWTTYSQLVNNGTVNININNYYGDGSEEEFSCDIQLDNSIFKDKKLLRTINECLDGHKVTKLAQLMSMNHKNYVYTGSDWFYFDSTQWILDHKSLNFKKHMLELCGLFNKIKAHYESKQTDQNAMGLIKNIKSLVTKLNKPQLKDDILKEAQLFFADIHFIKKLNSKKHLVPFGNGVYDLLGRDFRKTVKDDYINLTTGYDFDQGVDNAEVHRFIQQILPNQGVRDWVLKKMSECLNGDIPNTNFLMFIGDGANGKSQLLNLMKATIGEFGEKVEVTLLTRKRNNANEANSEKIKLMNKRFAFLSEPEDGEKINIGLLKELTGSEEIVARGLYQESVSFVMETKLFLACNELPEIKGEDTALWRRIRVVDFPSRFVDDPKDQGEYKIDRTLPSRMREDISWRQTFMNILIEYYYRDIKEPMEVQVKTNEYRTENNDFFNWLDENIEYKEGGILKLSDICDIYIGKKVGPRIMSKYKKELENFIKQKFSINNLNVNHTFSHTTFNGVNFKGWTNVSIKNCIND
jgi:P4 family phage/plasmid primase-like protien